MSSKRITSCLLILLLLAGCQASAQAKSAPSLVPTSAQSAAAPRINTPIHALPLASPTLAQVTPITLTPTYSPMDAPAAAPANPVPATPTLLSNRAPSLAAHTCGETEGRVENQTVALDPHGSTSVIVYLPPCYSPQAARGYPALYLLHGANTDNTQWIDLGVPGVADRLIQSRQVPPFLVVLPREENYMDSPAVSTYGDWVIHNLVPWVDQHYHTCAEQTCRAIGGLSRGGSWAFRIGLAGWQDFGAIGMDSAVPFGNDLAKSTAKFIQIPAAQRPRFYLDIGKSDESVSLAFDVAEVLTSQRITFEWHLSEGAHNRDYWRAHVEDYLRWYARGWN